MTGNSYSLSELNEQFISVLLQVVGFIFFHGFGFVCVFCTYRIEPTMTCRISNQS